MNFKRMKYSVCTLNRIYSKDVTRQEDSQDSLYFYIHAIDRFLEKTGTTLNGGQCDYL